MEFNLKYVAVFPRICSMFCEACAMCTGETVDQSNCVQVPRDIMCLPIGSQLLRSKILWMKHVVFWREPDGVIPRATGDWLTGRWDSRKVLRHCHNTWKNLNLRKTMLIIQVLTQRLKIRTFPGLLSKIFKSKDFSRAGTPMFQNKHFSRK